MNTKFLDALACRNSGRPPVWLMRQAGRYMPEYRALRAKHSFLELCHQPELAAEITHLPLKAFGLDAAILFSDILVVAEALEVGLRFEEKAGPLIDRPVRSAHDVFRLPSVDVKEKLGYVEQIIRLLKPSLQVPLIGFCGAPFTVASYMIEGSSSKSLQLTKKWLLTHPESFHHLLERITTVTIDYLKMQIEAGVDAIQIFDSWANFLGFAQFQEFSKAYLQRIVTALKEYQVPIILFCKGSAAFAAELAQINPAGIGIDWNAHLPTMRTVVKPTIALQGNLDPDVLCSSPETVRREAGHILKAMQGDPGYIFNLGHGILPTTPTDAVKALLETIHQ